MQHIKHIPKEIYTYIGIDYQIIISCSSIEFAIQLINNFLRILIFENVLLYTKLVISQSYFYHHFSCVMLFGTEYS